MNTKERIDKILTQITAFSCVLCRREELLDELMKLQLELVKILFNGTHAELSQLRIWDVKDDLIRLNEECNHVADEELQRIIQGCAVISNQISSEISGRRGERKAFWSLENIRCKSRLIKNVQFTEQGHRTELDAVMITEKAVFIIEVKNTSINIFIDKQGNYYRIESGEYKTDKNVGEKMNEKTFLLQRALEAGGFKNINIVGLMVFTNSSIAVENEYLYFRHCFLSDMPHIIKGYVGSALYTEDQMDKMVSCIHDAEADEAYPIGLDINQFKLDFATAVAKLEAAKSERQEPEEKASEVPEKKTETDFSSEEKKKWNTKSILKAAAVFALSAGVGYCTSKYFKQSRIGR